MSEKAQIDVRQGDKVVRIFSGWGTPRNILPALRAAARIGSSVKLVGGKVRPLYIARDIIKNVPDASFGLHIISEDYDPEDLSYRYVVDVAAKPWRVAQMKMPGYELIDNGDGTATPDDKLTPAITRNFRLAQ